MRIYLDNCCFNRPYDDQSQLTISMETQAKLNIQDMIRDKELELVSSDMLHYEVHNSPYEIQERAISEFLKKNVSYYVGDNKQDEVEELASEIMKTGVKYKDACHVASAIIAECEVFLTTDKRLLKYQTDKIKIMNPIDFIREREENDG